MIQIISHTGAKILIDSEDVICNMETRLTGTKHEKEYTIKVSGMTYVMPTGKFKLMLIKLIMKLAGMK